ncbi:Vacuolar protein sorting-associated protein 29 [Gaertneriomyces sp. JEL0708]|nr:Vacuolar protein sorting-associated protein 29 [Gaertneriomyces sp. JEL0708]
MLVLIIGDFHIPHRTPSLPSPFLKLLLPGKIHQILCTGNLTSRSTLDYLRTICPDILLVRGDMDETPPAPLSRVVTYGDLKVGVLHGHTVIPWGDPRALGVVAREMDVDVLVSGHTHRFEAWEHEGRFFVNPGSATGAYSGIKSPSLMAPATSTENDKSKEEDAKNAGADVETTPSFLLMDINGPTIVMYVYQLIKGEVRVEKLDYTKKLFT